MKGKYINEVIVHPVGIGTWLMGSGLYPDKTHYAVYGDEEQAIAAIRYSLNVGQNHIDTAQIYGLGHTEEIVGQAIQGYDRKKIFISSKLWKSHLKAEAIQKAIEAMLKRLQTDYLDLVYLHGYWEEYEPLEDQLKGLLHAKEKKLIRSIGVSNFNLDQLEKAQSICKISAIQNYYSLSNRIWATPELLTYCRQQNIAFIAAKPLERGKLLTPEWQKFLEPLAQKYQKTSAQIALSWLVSQENVHIIPKAIKKEHIDENVSLTVLTSEEISLLNTLSTV